MDTASLRIAVNTSDVKTASNDLDKLSKTSGNTEKSTIKLTESMSRLGSVLGGISLLGLASGSAVAADSLNRLDARLRLSTDSMAEFISQQKELYKIATDVHVPLQDITNLFIKIDPSLSKMGVTTKYVNQIVDTFAKGLKLGGATAEETSSSILQFSQAMGSGVLRGDEFNSLMENSPYLMRKMADGMGVPIGALRDMASNGELTAGKVSAALLKMSSNISGEFKQAYIGMSESMQNLKTEASLFSQELDKQIGVTSLVSGVISGLTNSLKDNKGAIGETVNTLKEYSGLVEGIATTIGVMWSAQKAALITEETYAKVKAVSNVVDTQRAVILEAETLAMNLGTYATEARIIATNVSTTGVINNRLATTAEIIAIQAEAVAAEEAALSQTAHALALRAAGVSAGFMGMALRAIPFIAVASTVALLATSFFDAKNKSDDLNKSLSDTAESLNKLTKSQLEYKRTTLTNELQDVGLELRKLKQEYGATSKRTAEQQKEVDDLTDSYNQLQNASKLVADAQTKMRNSISDNSNKAPIKKEKTLDETINILQNQPVRDKKAEATAEKEAKRVKGLSEEISKLKIENDNDVLKNQMDNDSKSYQDAIKKREEELVKFKGIKGAELEINREFNNTVEALNKQLIDKKNSDEIASSSEMYQIMNELSGNWYANEIINISNRAAAFALSGQSDISILKYVAEATQAIDAKLAIQSIDEMNNALFETKDILSGFNDFGANLDGIAGKIGNVAKTISDMSKNNQKFIKIDIDNQKKYAKAFLNANGDIEKEKEAQFNLDLDSTKLTEDKLNSEIAGYASLAGVMASVFEQGSAGAVAFTAVQSALGIASSWTAIAMSWAAGTFPANLPAVAAVTSAVLPIIAQLGGSSSGTGGTSVPSIQSGNNTEYNKKQIENNYTPMTDRLDRQIQLLESIDRNGSSSQLGVKLAGTTFEKDYKTWVENTLEVSRLAAASMMSLSDTQNIVKNVETLSGVDFYKEVTNSFVELNTQVLREGFNTVDALLATKQSQWGILGQGEVTSWDSPEGHAQFMGTVNNQLNDLQNIIQDWATGVVNSMNDLTAASKDFKSYFDDVTGSMFYETSRLSQAYLEVDKLRGKDSFANYLQNTITNIDALQSFFTDQTFSLLMSNNENDIKAQIAAIEELSAVTGQTFEGGAKEALNYLESIKLVSEAMATSRKNIDSFMESLRTSSENASILASSLGVSLATNVNELSTLFQQLAYDTNGLTDKDLELLNANKDLLTNTDEMKKSQDAYNKTLQDTTQSISTLEGALNTITSTIDKLKSASRTSEQNLQIFYEAMAEAQRLSKTDDYAGYAKAVQKAAETSSALFNKDNFTLTRDMEYAQLVAANQFTDLQDTTLTQVDYLKQIEINTRTQIDVLVAAMDALGTSISEALKNKINSISSSSVNPAITNSYQDILNRSPDTAGAAYWTDQISSGSISNSNIDDAIATAAIPEIYQSILGRAPDTAGAKYWADQLSSGAIAPDKIDDAIRAAAIANGELSSFAVGTPNVPYDMIAQIHQGEAIIPKPEAEAWRNGSLAGGQSALVSELKKNNYLLNGIITKQDQQIQILLDTKYIHNESLVVLTNVEGII